MTAFMIIAVLPATIGAAYLAERGLLELFFRVMHRSE